jgi:predicted  nucleic acid-binding Zn-ribbon protein
MQAEREKRRLLDEQQRMELEHSQAARTLSEELTVAKDEVGKLSAALADAEGRHKKALAELAVSSAQAAALQKQLDVLQAQVAEAARQVTLRAEQHVSHNISIRRRRDVE